MPDPATPTAPSADLSAPSTPEEMAARVRDGFAAAFGRPAEQVGRAPGRVNLIGEHTDYNAGLCLPLALEHSTYAAVAAREDRRLRILSAQSPAGTPAWEGDDLGPGAVQGWAAYLAGVVWALRDDGVDVPGLDVYVDSTVPVGAGLSSSAALECSLAVTIAHGVPVDRVVAACVRAETEVAGAPTGGLDQTVSMRARRDHALLLDFAHHTHREVPLPLDDAGLALLVVDTRVSHALVDGGYAARRRDCELAAEALGLPDLRGADLAAVETLDDDRLRRRARHVVTENERVETAVAALRSSDWATLGDAMDGSHASLRDDYEVSCPELDLTVETARAAGALGARMVGGGFGGSAVALVRADGVDAVVEAVRSAFAESFPDAERPGFLLALPGDGAAVVA